ncbi:SLC13 family permease [Hyphomonas sp.]|uniref:SLC13 family permease n=1 Tax=Hyphomonas sp. TaxID=87 RepID=UPI001D25C582|nr:SLC13 family permease [Hyphomonas sp.]MBU4062561.1 anion permease [Alphaproteobacteria bacterium]MBU4163912.1 anion permease [Alphaproteobacteria bacterium]
MEISQAWQIGAVFAAGLLAFASNRVRHDLIAILMLLAAVALGVVAPVEAFSGFGDPVVVTVACVMVLSASVARSGILSIVLGPFSRLLSNEVGLTVIFSGLCATASAFINNVGAVALLLPAALAACRSASVSPSRVLMPMAYASLLGGLVTLIGTPPNLLISQVRIAELGAGFSMFDFAPVGLSVAVVGLASMVLMRKMLPERLPPGSDSPLFKVADYLFEVRVAQTALDRELTVGDVHTMVVDSDQLRVHAIDREGIIFAAPNDTRSLKAGDLLQIEGRAPVLFEVAKTLGFEVLRHEHETKLDAAVFECVVPARSQLIMAHNPQRKLSIVGASLIAVSRNGRSLIERLDTLRLQAGDVLLLQASDGTRAAIVEAFRLLPLADRTLSIGKQKLDWRAPAVMFGAVMAASLAVAPLAIALLSAIAVLTLLGRIGGKAYSEIDWSIIVLLACLLPVAQAFTTSGAGTAIGIWIADVTTGASAIMVIFTVLALTMVVTPFVNNAAAVLLMAPIALEVGRATGVAPDAMLMAVALGASSAFITPIGHQSNTLVMGPGGYHFFDYVRIGAPLSAVVLVLGTIMIRVVWL